MLKTIQVDRLSGVKNNRLTLEIAKKLRNMIFFYIIDCR